jgi:hypothetical protein
MNQDHSNPNPISTPKPSVIPVIVHDQKEKFFNKTFTNVIPSAPISQPTIFGGQPLKSMQPIKPESPKPAIRSSEMLKPTYRPMMKSILIEALYSLIFTHHIPILMKQGTLMDDTPLINFNSVAQFLTSYFGKIIFFLTIYFTLHYLFLPFIRKIDFP